MVREFNSKMIMAFHGSHGNKDICNHIIYTYRYFLSLLFQLISSLLFYRAPIDLVWKQTWYEVIWCEESCECGTVTEVSSAVCLQLPFSSHFHPIVLPRGARLNGAFSLAVINFWPPPCANMPTLTQHLRKSWGCVRKVTQQIARMVKFGKKFDKTDWPHSALLFLMALFWEIGSLHPLLREHLSLSTQNTTCVASSRWTLLP